MKEKFSWIPIYRNLVLKVLEYEKKQDELINIIFDIQDKIGQKKSGDGKYKIIDPLSFLNIIDVYGDKTRNVFIEEFESKTNMDILIPKDYSGVPATKMQHFITVDPESSKELWNLTKVALDYEKDKSKSNRKKFIEMYNKVSDAINRNDNHKIVNNLYKLCPNTFVDLADPDRELLNGLGIDYSDYKTGEGYINLCDEVNDKILANSKKYKTFYELSDYAYACDRDEGEIKYFICSSNAKRQKFSFFNTVEGDYINYVEETKNQYPKNIKKNDLLIGYDTTINGMQAAVCVCKVVDITILEDENRNIKIEIIDRFDNPVMYNDTIKNNDKLRSIMLNKSGMSRGAFSLRTISEEQYNTFIKLSSARSLSEEEINHVSNKINKILQEENNIKKGGNHKMEQNRGFNKIYFGVPGCGKSWYISKNLDYIIYNDRNKHVKQSNIIRTVFHPDYTNTDFVGQIIPSISDKGLDYVPSAGPFTIALEKAYETDEPIVLIIEEINRGNAAAIFGDIFQLLDRKDENNFIINPFISQYANKFNKNFENSISKGIKLPSNLFILATMNTSDQNVYPLDTAFKRRWDMEYISNSFITKDDKEIGRCLIPNSNNINWETFVTIINEQILDKENNIIEGEDKQIGKYFVSKDFLVEVGSNISQEEELNKFKEFRDKVLVYLFEDVTKYDHGVLFDKSINTLDKLMKKNRLEDIIKVDFDNEK